METTELFDKILDELEAELDESDYSRPTKVEIRKLNYKSDDEYLMLISCGTDGGDVRVEFGKLTPELIADIEKAYAQYLIDKEEDWPPSLEEVVESCLDLSISTSLWG